MTLKEFLDDVQRTGGLPKDENSWLPEITAIILRCLIEGPPKTNPFSHQIQLEKSRAEFQKQFGKAKDGDELKELENEILTKGGHLEWREKEK